jgi:hypothetical protein
VGSDGKTKRFRAEIVDLAFGSYSPSKLSIVSDTPTCQEHSASTQASASFQAEAGLR